MRLVWAVVQRFLNRGYEADDLFQIGCIGLLKSVDKFNLEYDVKFSTYAVPMIIGEIQRFLRDDGIVKVSRTLKENGMKAKVVRQKLQNRLYREPTIQEIAEEAVLTVEEIVLAMEADTTVESIYSSVYQDDGSEVFLVDKVVANSGTSVGTSFGASNCPMGNEDVEKEELLNHMLLEQLMGELQEEEKELITLRYYKNKTQVEVAKKLGISQVQVSRMEKKILIQKIGRAHV